MDDEEFINELGGANVPIQRDFRQEDFLFDEVSECFIKIDTGAELSATAVNGMIPKEFWDRIPILDAETGEPSLRRDGSERWEWLRPAIQLMKKSYDRVVSGRTWWPGLGKIVEGYKIEGQMLVEEGDCSVFNDYTPPQRPLPSWKGDTSMFDTLCDGLTPEGREVFLDRMAFHVQRPGVKINGIFILFGPQGHGKDSLFAAMNKYFGGMFQAISVNDLFSDFNPWRKSCLCMINETSSKDHSSMEIYEAIKTVSVSPPQFLRVNDKNVKATQIVNAVSMYCTTNHERALYFEEDDRRIWLYKFENTIAHTGLRAEFFERFHAWIEGGGWKAVIQKLSLRDISKFNPAKNAEMTDAKSSVIETIRAVRSDIVDDIIVAFLGGFARKVENESARPTVMMLRQLYSEENLESALGFNADDGSIRAARAKIEKNNQLPHKMRDYGYEPIPRLKYKGNYYRGIYYDTQHFVNGDAADQLQIHESSVLLIRKVVLREDVEDFDARLAAKKAAPEDDEF